MFVNGSTTPSHEYTYDPNGNRDGASYDAQDRLLSDDQFAYEYSANGDLTKKTHVATGSETRFRYDARGNLRSVDQPAPLASIEYIIDGLDRRIGKRVGGSLAQGYLYDGSRVIAELDSSGAIRSQFIYALGGPAPDFMVRSGTTYRFVKDHLGGPKLVINVSTGEVAQRLDFDEWGVVLADSNPGFQPSGLRVASGIATSISCALGRATTIQELGGGLART